MAKRELITREEAIKTVRRWIKSDMILGLSLFEMMMNEIPPITEQEIVKPYLEAIESEAIKYSGTGEREIQAYDEGLLKAIEIIKKLLSEQEAKHGSN